MKILVNKRKEKYEEYWITFFLKIQVFLNEEEKLLVGEYGDTKVMRGKVDDCEIFQRRGTKSVDDFIKGVLWESNNVDELSKAESEIIKRLEKIMTKYRLMAEWEGEKIIENIK